jgi:hypothetical protein
LPASAVFYLLLSENRVWGLERLMMSIRKMNRIQAEKRYKKRTGIPKTRTERSNRERTGKLKIDIPRRKSPTIRRPMISVRVISGSFRRVRR